MEFLPLEPDRRNYVRIRADVQASLTLLFPDGSRHEESSEAMTHNLSGGGMLLEGRIMRQDCVGALLMGHVLIGLRIRFPGQIQQVAAIGRAAWLEEIRASSCTYRIGIRFTEITRDDRDRITRFILQSTLGPDLS